MKLLCFVNVKLSKCCYNFRYYYIKYNLLYFSNSYNNSLIN